MILLHQRKRRKKNKVQVYSLDDTSTFEDIPTVRNSSAGWITWTVVAAVPHWNINLSHQQQDTLYSDYSSTCTVEDSPASILLWINFPTFNFWSYLIQLSYLISDHSSVWYYVQYYKVQGHTQYTPLTHGQHMHHCTLRHSTMDTCI